MKSKKTYFLKSSYFYFINDFDIKDHEKLGKFYHNVMIRRTQYKSIRRTQYKCERAVNPSFINYQIFQDECTQANKINIKDYFNISALLKRDGYIYHKKSGILKKINNYET